jgi:hypothetical protein
MTLRKIIRLSTDLMTFVYADYHLSQIYFHCDRAIVLKARKTAVFNKQGVQKIWRSVS